MVNKATITTVDVKASNGVIHVMIRYWCRRRRRRALLVADAMEDEAMEDEAMEDEAGGGTIVDVAVEAGTFETLVAAVTAAGLARR